MVPNGITEMDAGSRLYTMVMKYWDKLLLLLELGVWFLFRSGSSCLDRRRGRDKWYTKSIRT